MLIGILLLIVIYNVGDCGQYVLSIDGIKKWQNKKKKDALAEMKKQQKAVPSLGSVHLWWQWDFLGFQKKKKKFFYYNYVGFKIVRVEAGFRCNITSMADQWLLLVPLGSCPVICKGGALLWNPQIHSKL